MDWSSNLRPFVYRPEASFNSLYDFPYNPYQGMEVKQTPIAEEATNGFVPKIDKMKYGTKEKKKRLTNDQLESLERSFNEEIKLDPDRKRKLSCELGLQPRQIAVWFQNRRARLKAKQLEHLYGALKQKYDNVSNEKQKLQEEVMKLKAALREQATRKQASTGYSEIISAGETMETTSVAAIRSCDMAREPRGHHQIVECNYLLNKDEYNPLSSSYWALLPTYP